MRLFLLRRKLFSSFLSFSRSELKIVCVECLFFPYLIWEKKSYHENLFIQNIQRFFFSEESKVKPGDKRLHGLNFKCESIVSVIFFSLFEKTFSGKRCVSLPPPPPQILKLILKWFLNEKLNAHTETKANVFFTVELFFKAFTLAQEKKKMV